MRIVCIIQARMGSKRCPGKVMREIKGKPLIGYLLDRVAMFSHMVDGVIVAIPAVDAGSSLEKYLKTRAGVAVYCGAEENDVAGRFAGALKTGSWDYFIRLCADSPLFDTTDLERALDTFLSGPAVGRFIDCTIFSNVGSAFCPAGQHFEIVSTKQFLELEPGMSGLDREHVTTAIHRVLDPIPMAVDTEEDFDRIKSLIGEMERPAQTYDLEECQKILRNLRPRYLV